MNRTKSPAICTQHLPSRFSISCVFKSAPCPPPFLVISQAELINPEVLVSELYHQVKGTALVGNIEELHPLDRIRDAH